RIDFGLTDVGVAMDDLAMQVAQVDSVVVDNAERADAGRGQIERRRRTEAARADEQDFGRQKLALADGADLGQDDVARVAARLVHRERGAPGGSVAGAINCAVGRTHSSFFSINRFQWSVVSNTGRGAGIPSARPAVGCSV